MIRSMQRNAPIIHRTPSPPSAADEVNHRVANHLQLIAGFISVEARSVSDAPMLAMLSRIQQRIAAIGNVHRQLYLAGRADVDLGGYLDTLGEQLAQSYAPHRRVVVDADTVGLHNHEELSIDLMRHVERA